jgi:hypothetical protein
MLGDWQWVDRDTYRQEKWLTTWLDSVERLVVVKMGAGRTVSTVRRFAERRGPWSIRINPRPPSVGAGISCGALETLKLPGNLLNASS